MDSTHFPYGRGSAGTGTGTARSPWGCQGHNSLELLNAKLTEQSKEYVNTHFPSTQWGGGFNQKLLALIYFYTEQQNASPLPPTALTYGE